MPSRKCICIDSGSRPGACLEESSTPCVRVQPGPAEPREPGLTERTGAEQGILERQWTGVCASPYLPGCLVNEGSAAEVRRELKYNDRGEKEIITVIFPLGSLI